MSVVYAIKPVPGAGNIDVCLATVQRSLGRRFLSEVIVYTKDSSNETPKKDVCLLRKVPQKYDPRHLKNWLRDRERDILAIKSLHEACDPGLRETLERFDSEFEASQEYTEIRDNREVNLVGTKIQEVYYDSSGKLVLELDNGAVVYTRDVVTPKAS